MAILEKQILTAHRTLIGYEIVNSYTIDKLYEFLKDLHFVRAVDGVWVPDCDLDQYSRGERQPEDYIQRVWDWRPDE